MLCEKGTAGGEAWNFGPEQCDAQPVEWIVRELAELWGMGAEWELENSAQPHEAGNLKLDWSKAAARLDWRPVLRLKDALAMTFAWYKARRLGQDMHLFTVAQIEQYEKRRQPNATTGTFAGGGAHERQSKS
jgi:CDP-glucose 4,6-dehydratase